MGERHCGQWKAEVKALLKLTLGKSQEVESKAEPTKGWRLLVIAWPQYEQKCGWLRQTQLLEKKTSKCRNVRELVGSCLGMMKLPRIVRTAELHDDGFWFNQSLFNRHEL